MKIVLVDPITKRPTAEVPWDGMPMFFSGPHQNVALVKQQWLFINGKWFPFGEVFNQQELIDA